jgi:hypothetical protein
MASRRKIEANRLNARMSTGPKTALGKARAARNARRHGLSVSVISDPVLSEQVELLAREITDATADNEIYQLARRVAEAQIDLVRVRHARHDFFIGHINDPRYVSEEALIRAYKAAYKFGRKNRMRTPLPPELVELLRLSSPRGSRQVAAILSDFRNELDLMDRYERRALSRRKFAIRAFDLARTTNQGMQSLE